VKAVVYDHYGTVEQLHLEEMPLPTPKDNEALIKVHAASINDWDWGLLEGKPFANRVTSGLFDPKIRVLGSDIAGTVEAVGSSVTKFQQGDEVFGDLCQCGWGGFAEYVCAQENALTLKPASLSFKQAAALPQAGLLALQGLQHKGLIQAGQKVLINGAGGGAGSFAVQIAKSMGAEVTGVDRASKFEVMRKVGADHLIDYQTADFTQNGQQYDRILDCCAQRSIFDTNRSLNPGGIYSVMGGATGRIMQTLLLSPWLSMRNNKKIGIVLYKPNQGIMELIELIESGKVVPEIDRTYSLSEVPEAMKHFGRSEHQGKIVITMELNEPN